MSKTKESPVVEEVFNPLSSKRILVKYIMKHKNGVTQKNHPAYGGMLDVATTTFYLKKSSKNSGWVDPFTPEEASFVAKELGIEPIRLSPHYRGADCYWNDYTISLDKMGDILNMSGIEDFIKYKVLLTNDGLIAPSHEQIKNKPSYRYYFVDEDDEIAVKSTGINSRKDAYISYGKISTNKDKLGYIIWQMTKQIPSANTKIDVLQAKMMEGDLLETRSETFNKTFTDKLFEYKVLVYKALTTGVITRKNEEYYMENAPIVGGGSTGNLDNTARFLADPVNQETKFLIEDRIKTTKE